MFRGRREPDRDLVSKNERCQLTSFRGFRAARMLTCSNAIASSRLRVSLPDARITAACKECIVLVTLSSRSGCSGAHGVLTGIGGGMERDVLLSEVPVVFTAELYAVAFAGAAVVLIGDAVFFMSGPAAAIGRVVSVALRLMAIRKGWKLPVARQPD